jgi:hypothetical protein
MCDVECGQNLLACLILIRGDKGVDIDTREECGCEMGDGPEKNGEAGNGTSVRTISWVGSSSQRCERGSRLWGTVGRRDSASREPFCMSPVRSC